MSDAHIQMNGPMHGAMETSITRLARKYQGVFTQETVARAVEDSWERLTQQATLIPPFFPTLVERFANDQLRAAAQVGGLIPKPLPEVLFVCEHNAGRSQMAAALAHQLAGGRVGVRCAGSRPAEHIHPVVAEAMAEIGLDISHEFPKPLTDIVVQAADVVVTMGCGEACPIYPGKHYEDWGVADPAGQSIEAVRQIRIEIEQHVRQLLSAMLTEKSAEPPVPAHPA